MGAPLLPPAVEEEGGGGGLESGPGLLHRKERRRGFPNLRDFLLPVGC